MQHESSYLTQGNEVIVSELIEFLQKEPQDIKVAIQMYSEQYLLDVEEIEIRELCLPRQDGWIQNKRPDKKTESYLVFPGN